MPILTYKIHIRPSVDTEENYILGSIPIDLSIRNITVTLEGLETITKEYKELLEIEGLLEIGILATLKSNIPWQQEPPTIHLAQFSGEGIKPYMPLNGLVFQRILPADSCIWMHVTNRTDKELTAHVSIGY